MKYIYFPIFIVIVSIFSLHCKRSESKHICTKNFKRTLGNIDTSRIVNFNDISCFEWEKLLIIAPAFNRERVEQLIDISLPAKVSYNWKEDGEGYRWWILFISENKVSDYFYIDRQNLDFSMLMRELKQGNDYILLNKENTKFITYYTGDYFYNTKKKVIDVKLVK